MKTWKAVVIGILTGLLIGGAIYWVASPHPQGTISFVSPTQSNTVTISITGQVAHPGVYSLLSGSRINDAISAAGEPLANADLSGIPLAQLLEDQENIIIPSIETEQTTSLSNSQGKINLNTATLEQLESLPGIGEGKAQDIIDFRTNNGNFSSIEDLLAVPGFGPTIFSTIKDKIEVD
jgi:competence protein ComEA